MQTRATWGMERAGRISHMVHGCVLCVQGPQLLVRHPSGIQLHPQQVKAGRIACGLKAHTAAYFQLMQHAAAKGQKVLWA
jgi:hypothetical protein